MTARIPGYTPSQSENMMRAARIVLSGTWSMLPVEVTAFERAEGCVDVSPVIRDRAEDNAVVDIPDIVCVPVLWPFLGGGYSGVFDLAEGDTGIVLLASRSISSWVVSGIKGADPEGSRQGALMDAVFIPGLRPLNGPPAALAEEGLHIGLDDGTARLSIHKPSEAPDVTYPLGAAILTSDDVRLGSPSATDFVALASLVFTELSALRNWAATHVHPETGGNTGAPLAAPPVVGSVAATKVKAE